jgi:hypothetical protein
MGQVSKLGYVDSKLGAPTSGQQTTRILFNTIENPGTTSTLVFFKNFQGLSEGQTNLNQNKLDASESVVIKTITLQSIQNSTRLATFGGPSQQTVSVIVGNQTVIKNLPIQFNQGGTGQSFDRLHENGGTDTSDALQGDTDQVVMPCEIRLLTDIVIPPQVSFEVRVESNNAVYGSTNSAVTCILAGYGKIFSAGASF